MQERTERTFGDLLRRRRVDAGLTHEALAERAGLSARSISDLERGVARGPRATTLALLADALGLVGDDRGAFEAVARGGIEPASGGRR
jgi:transcriptional regulator with XRE-family HTH domain